MTPVDHNKTLVLLYSLLSAVFAIPLVASPWIIAKNMRRPEQLPLSAAIFCIVIFLFVLFLSTALTLHRRRALGRKLALASAVLTLPLCWPLGVYTWWFMHTEGGKKMYRTAAD